MMSCSTRGLRMLSVLPRAGEVLVVARVVRQQPVVGAVVDAAQRQRRPEVIALGGVVVDDVEDDFEVGGVEGTHHDLELAHGFERQRREREAHVGCEERERVVAPVVVQALLNEVALIVVVMDGHQLDGGDAE